MANLEGQAFTVSWGGTPVGSVTNVSSDTSRDSTETTDFDSGDRKEFIPSRATTTFSIDFNYDNEDTDTQAALQDWEDGVVDTLEIAPGTPSTGDETWSCDGFATAVGREYPDGGLVTRTVDFQMTGEPTITYEAV